MFFFFFFILLQAINELYYYDGGMTLNCVELLDAEAIKR